MGMWLAAAERVSSKTSAVRLCQIRPGTSSADPGSCDFVGLVTTSAAAYPILGGTNFGSIRTGLTVSFGVNRVRGYQMPDGFVLPHEDFYFAYQQLQPQLPDTMLHIGATACRLVASALSSFDCKDVPDWGTGTANQQFEPELEVSDRSAAQDGSALDLAYAYYESDSPAVAPGHARVRRAVLQGSPFHGPAPFATLEDLPLAPDPSVCTAEYGPLKYWGDFFGFRYVPVGQFSRHVAIYSSDEGAGCSKQVNVYQGRALHVQSWFWPN